MRTKILKVIGGTLTALALATAPAYAGDGTSSSAAGPCGFYVSSLTNSAWYNHCNSNVNVLIRVERAALPDYDLCVSPGETYLGKHPEPYDAWYKGVLC
ncbi:hypothetical protein GCM10022252_63360 [Streptosporangium oxazolinicum]|uniref:Secreted protein n=1 Tax=Streptosporangium oxazolinicum TaxID=909287 RepID=A0ABP8BDT6_9ACTN